MPPIVYASCPYMFVPSAASGAQDASLDVCDRWRASGPSKCLLAHGTHKCLPWCTHGAHICLPWWTLILLTSGLDQLDLGPSMSLHTTTHSCHDFKRGTLPMSFEGSNSLEGCSSRFSGVRDLEKGTEGSSGRCLVKLMTLVVAAMAIS
jgi:hypothetical protein